MGGRPAVLAFDFHRQYSLKPLLCHVMTVSGCTMRSTERHAGQSRESQTQKRRFSRAELGSFDRLFKHSELLPEPKIFGGQGSVADDDRSYEEIKSLEPSH